MYMKRIFSLLLLTISVSISLSAQTKGNCNKMQQWLQEMNQAKAEFVAKDMALSQEQRAKFIPLYKSMNEETAKLAGETRDMERRIDKSPAASDEEYEQAATAMYELNGKRNAIEMRYFAKYKTILTKPQLYKLKKAEDKWHRQLMKKRHEAKNRHH